MARIMRDQALIKVYKGLNLIGAIGKSVKTSALKILDQQARNFNASLKEANMKISAISLSPAITSTNKMITFEVKDIDTSIAALDATEDSFETVIDYAKLQISLYATAPFIFYPGVALMENGETVSYGEADSEDPNALVKSQITGIHYLAWGPEVVPRMEYSNGTPYWSANIEFNTQSISQFYAKYFQQKKFAEEDPMALKLFGAIRANTGTTIQIKGWYKQSYHSREMDVAETLIT